MHWSYVCGGSSFYKVTWESMRTINTRENQESIHFEIFNTRNTMIHIQRLAILVVLSFAQIDAALRQNNNCPQNDPCAFAPCSNGVCVDDQTTAECFRCFCPADFTGQRCETQITTPSGCNPGCLNGGTCIQVATNVSICVCTADFTGNQCETSVTATHPCVTMPGSVCLNGGTCTINGAGFLCNCPAEFSGLNCETPITMPTACAVDTCNAHGTCRQSALPTGQSIIYCACDIQWTGLHCETSVNANCTPDYCQANGTCVTSASGPYCICPSTHVGQQCEIPISTTTLTTATMTTSTATLSPTTGDCSSNPCLNGGTCYNTGNSFICLCRPQYTGQTCGQQTPVTATPVPTTTAGVNPCALNPCLNGGSCYKYGSSFVCVCTTQYAGLTCDAAKTTTIPSVTTPSSTITCANQPCQNGATCYNAGNDYYCYCGSNSSFNGKNCDTPKVTSDTKDCPLDCSPGYCVRAGHDSNSHACMCSGTLTPGSCRSK